MIDPMIPPLHVSELSHLQTVALWNVGADAGRHYVDLDGYVNDDRLAEALRCLGMAEAAEAVQA
ncbi:hypothetical protein [Rhodococcus sp. NPDC047139]|uniref:hypothetical protein n=1 Tax=Rhodococcus sp. NPDC047139 TaxID=3155141 RepID=UPI0033EB531E